MPSSISETDCTSTFQCRIAKTFHSPVITPETQKMRSARQVVQPNLIRPMLTSLIRTVGSNIAGGYQRLPHLVVGELVLIRRSIPGRDTATGPSKSRETGPTASYEFRAAFPAATQTILRKISDAVCDVCSHISVTRHFVL